MICPSFPVIRSRRDHTDINALRRRLASPAQPVSYIRDDAIHEISEPMTDRGVCFHVDYDAVEQLELAGTSGTNTIVALGHLGNGDELERAFTGATVHDMFNFLPVGILFPVELITRYYTFTSLPRPWFLTIVMKKG